jgi:cold-inducible RNA-binding protein
MGLRLYVGNLSFRTTADDVRASFTQFGQVTEVRIMMDRTTGRPRGFAFVAMSRPTEVQAAIAGMNGVTLDGRELQVNEALAQEASGAESGQGDNRDRRAASGGAIGRSGRPPHGRPRGS